MHPKYAWKEAVLHQQIIKLNLELALFVNILFSSVLPCDYIFAFLKCLSSAVLVGFTP